MGDFRSTSDPRNDEGVKQPILILGAVKCLACHALAFLDFVPSLTFTTVCPCDSVHCLETCGIIGPALCTSIQCLLPCRGQSDEPTEPMPLGQSVNRIVIAPGYVRGELTSRNVCDSYRRTPDFRIRLKTVS
jgi:hypothetical protein